MVHISLLSTDGSDLGHIHSFCIDQNFPPPIIVSYYNEFNTCSVGQRYPAAIGKFSPRVPE